MTIEETTATVDETVPLVETATELSTDVTGSEGPPSDAPVIPSEPTLPADDPAGAPSEETAVIPLPEPEPTAPDLPEQQQEPWGFRVDGARVDPTGAYRTPHDRMIHIPEDVWDRTIRPNYMGHRPSWERERTHFQQQLAAAADENRPEIIRANTFAERILGILDLDPVERDEELEKLRREIPVLEAKAEAQAAKQQAAAFRGEVEERHQTELAQTVVPILQDELGGYIQRALQSDQLKDLGLDPKELHQTLWEDFGIQLFADADEDAHFQTPAGGVRFDVKRIDRFLLREGEVVRRERARNQDLLAEQAKQLKAARDAAAAAVRNAAVLAPDPAPAPPVVPAAGGLPAGETPKPWHDMSKTFDERKAAWDEHARQNGWT